MEGDRPPCNPKISPSTIADKGNKSNKSVKYFHTFEFPYLRTDSS